MAKRYRTWRDIGSGRVRSSIKNGLIDSLGGEEGTRAFEQGPRYFKEREAAQQQQQTPTYMQQPMQPAPGSLTYKVNPTTGLTSKVTVPSATLAQVKSGQANWTDMLVADRNSILKNPTFYQQNQITKYAPAVQQQMLSDPSFQWDKLPGWQKMYYETSSNPIKAGAVQGLVMGAANPVGGAVTGAVIGAVGGWAGYDQNKEAWQQGDGKFTWNVQQLKEIGKGALGYMNLLAEFAEKTIGTTAMVANAVVDPNKEVADYLNKDAWNANMSFFETIAPAYKAVVDSEKGGFQASDLVKIAPAIYQVGVLGSIILNPEKYKGEELMLGAALPVELKQSWTERLDQARKEVAAGRNYREVATEMQNGIMAQLGDMAGQGIADPLNTTSKVQTGIGKKVSEISGNKVAAEAFTNTNGLREAAVKFKTLATTETLAKNIDPNFSLKNLNWLERAVAGTTKEGGIRTGSLLPTEKGMLDPIQATDLNPMNPGEAIKAAVTRPLDFAKYMTEQDPKSRAQAGLTMFDRNIGSILAMFQNPAEAAGYLRRIAAGDNTAWADMGSKAGNSPEWYTVLPALKDYTGEKLTALADAWELTTKNRDALNKMAELVGRTPTQLIEDWAKKNTHVQDLETIRAKAQEQAAKGNAGAKAILDSITKGELNVKILAEIVDIFHGPGALPHTEAQWKWAMYSDLSDHFAGWAADHMLINQSPEARSTFFQTVGILKQAQSIALLGMSPGYAIQNGVSGIAHLMFTGIYGTMTPRQMTDWVKRWEMKIPRMDEGVGIGGIVDTNGMDAISKAGMPEGGPLTNIRRTLSTISRGMPMSKLSSQFESINSKRGYVTGIQQFFSRTWRRGVGFRKMDPTLIKVLQDAGINPDHIYAAYEAGVNRAEIENALSGNYKGVKVNSLVHEAAQIAGVTAGEAVDMMNRIGLTDLLDTYLKGATTKDAVDAAFIRAENNFQAWTDMRLSTELKTKAVEIANRIDKEGATAGLDIAQRVSHEFYDAWFDHYDRFGEVMSGLEALDPGMRSKAIDLAYKQSDTNFRRVFNNMATSYQGVFDAWSLSGDANALNALHAISDMNTSMKEAYDFMRQKRNELSRILIAEDRAPTFKEVAAVNKSVNAAFETAFKAKHAAEMKMGDALREIYTKRYGKVAGDAAFLWWRDVSKFGEKVSADEKRFRKSLDDARAAGATRADIADAKKKYYSENKQQFIADLEDINAKGIARLEKIIKRGTTEPTPEPTPVPVQPTPPSDAAPAAQTPEAIAPPAAEPKPKKLTKAQEKAKAEQEQIRQMMGEVKQIYFEERAAKAKHIKELWDVAKDYGYDSTIIGGHGNRFALLGALQKEEYGGIKATSLEDVRFTQEKVREILEKRKAIKEAEAEKAAPPSIKKIKKAKAKNEANIDLLATIRTHGGLNMKYNPDNKSMFGLFQKYRQNATGWEMGDLARTLAEEDHFPINLNDPNDPGGVRQLEELLSRSLAGEKIYPVGHDYIADPTKVAEMEADHAIALAEDAAQWAAEEAPFDAEKWHADMKEASKAQDFNRMSELMGEIPQEMNNAAHDADGETYAEYTSRVWDEADAQMQKDIQAEALAKAKTDADATLKAEEVHADAVITRTIMEEKWTEIFGAEKAQVYMELSDAYAGWYEKTTGDSADDFYSRFYKDARRMAEMDYEDVMAGLRQLAEKDKSYDYRVAETIQERAKTDQDIQNWARMVSRSEEAARDALSNETNIADKAELIGAIYEGDNETMAQNLAYDAIFGEPDKWKRVALIDAIHELNPTMATMAERLARANLGELQQNGEPVHLPGADEAGRGVKGAVSFDVDGIQATIYAFESADFSTLIHENAHVFRRMLADVAARTNNAQVKADLTTIEEWAGVKDGNWTVEHEEKFARGFENYVATGEAPTPKLQEAFKAFKTWMMEIYKTIAGSSIDVKITPEVKAVFDRMLGAEQQEPAPKPRTKSDTPYKENLDAIKQRQGADVVAFLQEKIKSLTGLDVVQGLDVYYKNITEKATQALKTYKEYVAKYGEDYPIVLIKDQPTNENRPWQGSVITPSTEHAGKWQITYFDDFGFSGHTVENTKTEAYWNAFGEGTPRIDPDKLEQASQTDNFKAGVQWSQLPEDQKFNTSLEQILQKMKQAGGPDTLLQRAEPVNLTGELPNGSVEEASQQMPVGTAMAEGFNDHVRPLMDALKQAAKNQLNNKPLNGATRDLTPEGQAMLNKYQKQVMADLAGTKNAATKWGESQRDFAMLDYNKRYGIDRYIDSIFPYQFFYTRSLATWAARALDKPALFSHYARIQRQQDRYERDIPERLRGKIKIPMPWMPDWMGDGLYIDPMKSIFTPLNYLRPFERLMADNTQQELEAERILQEWASDQSVPEKDIVTAAQTRAGTTWDRALAEAKIRRESEISSPIDFMSSMFGPAWYLTTPAKLLGIKNFPGSKGGKETITSTPILNTLRAADTITQGTWAEPFGDMLGALGKPEELLRQKLGLPELGEYGDYYIDRQLANMVADGKINSDQAQTAMIERTGATFEEARERVKYELAMRVPGASALMAGLTADNFAQGVGRLAATAPASMFGAGMLPAGELEYRGLKQEWNEALKRSTAITSFFDEHPEYEAYLSKGKDPETRLRSYLVGQIWDGYMALGTTDRKTATAEMGDSFQRDFLSTETRSLESLDVDQLARWAQMLQQSVPTTQATAGALAQPSEPVNLYDPRITQVTDKYFNDRKALFPAYYEEQAAYYNIPQADKSARLAYLSAHPKLKDYWTWNKAYKDKYPELLPIFTGQVFKDVDTTAWPPALVDYVQVYAMTGDKLPKGAWKALEQVWMAEGAPMGDMQSWLDNEVAPSVLYGGQQ